MTPRGKGIVQWATAAESAAWAMAYEASNQFLRDPGKSVRLQIEEIWVPKGLHTRSSACEPQRRSYLGHHAVLYYVIPSTPDRVALGPQLVFPHGIPHFQCCPP